MAGVGEPSSDPRALGPGEGGGPRNDVDRDGMADGGVLGTSAAEAASLDVRCARPKGSTGEQQRGRRRGRVSLLVVCRRGGVRRARERVQGAIAGGDLMIRPT